MKNWRITYRKKLVKRRIPTKFIPLSVLTVRIVARILVLRGGIKWNEYIPKTTNQKKRISSPNNYQDLDDNIKYLLRFFFSYASIFSFRS